MISDMSGLGDLDAWCDGELHANGVDIGYRRSTRGGIPLVGLHGLIGSGACLLPLARALGKGFDVVLPDARGHGRSSAPDRGYLYSDHAADVAGLIGALELNRPVLLGHSMGGMTAAVSAATLGTGISALVLVDPTFISPEWQREVYEGEVSAEHGRLLKSTRDHLIAEARARHPQRPAEMIGQLVDARLATSPHAFEVLTPPNPDWRELIRRMRIPTLLLIGDRGVVSSATARELESESFSLRYEVIADAGHGLPYDRPEAAGAAVSAFLAEVTAASGIGRSA